MFLVATATLTIFTIVSLFGGRSTPMESHGLAMLVYVLPLLLLGDVFMLVYWGVQRKWHWMVMPLIAILACIPYIGTFYQPSILSKADDSGVGIVVATYNVKSFGRETSGFRSGDILTEMKSQYVDILCLQEYSDISGDRLNSNTYKDYFPYMSYGKDDMVIYSRFPIKESGTIDFGETNNSAMWADIIVNGKEIRIFNAHLETTGFNRSLHKVAKMELQGQVVKESAIIKMIYENYTMGMVARSHQSEQVAKEIEESPNPVIVCGDFNDIPYSYTYYTMLGNLVDGFKECGSGWMSTFRDRKKFRIDYIFHDHALQGRTYYKLDLSYSDHDPVFMKIAFK